MQELENTAPFPLEFNELGLRFHEADAGPSPTRFCWSLVVSLAIALSEIFSVLSLLVFLSSYLYGYLDI